MESLIVRGLSKQFDGRVVLDKLDFEVVPGEFLSILGPSGCGKTTLLRSLMGLSEPDEGSILLDGQEITRFPPDKRQMGIVFQNYALFENMTVLRNVEYALHLHPELKAQARQTAFRLLEQMGLSEQMDKYPAQLSGGQMQRVAVARTLALSPSIILFDEPMSALDVATRLSLRTELKQIQQDSGATMIYITHDQEEAFVMSDRIMVMGNGQIHQLATPEQLLADPADDYVRTFVIENLEKKIGSLMRYAPKEGGKQWG